MSWVWLDGELVRDSEARIPATDRGVLFARGVYETFRAAPGKAVYRLRDHIARLEAGAAALGITPTPSPDRVETAVAALMERASLKDARVRLTLTAGPEGGLPSTLIQARPATDYTPEMYENGVAAITATVRRNETSPLVRHKTLSCLDNILAGESARRAGAMQAILLNTQGLVAEGNSSNVFIVSGGELLTPRIEDGALPGVTRAAVLALARTAGTPAVERAIKPEELHRADEAFLTNAAAYVLPVVTLDGAPIGAGAPGPLTRAIADHVQADRSRAN